MISYNSNIYRFFMIFWLISVLLIIIGSLWGKITFGYGLGDFIYLFPTIAVLLIFGIIYITDMFKNILTPSNRTYMLVLCALVLTAILLKITIFRGPEYSWNGQFFY